jgi:hypothetical protein
MLQNVGSLRVNQINNEEKTMFLNRLNQIEKEAFLELAHHVARSDEDFSENQKEIISQYCMEMSIEDIEYDDSKFVLDRVLAKIECKKSQKIVLLEVMALVYSDGLLHDAEKEIIDNMIEKYSLNQALATVYAEWAKSTLALYIQGNALIEL